MAKSFLQIFEKFLSNLGDNDISQNIENFFEGLFSGTKAYFWENVNMLT